MIRRKIYKMIAMLSAVSLFAAINPITTFAAPEVTAKQTEDLAEAVTETNAVEADQAVEPAADADAADPYANVAETEPESFAAETARETDAAEKAPDTDATEKVPETETGETNVSRTSSDQQDPVETVEETNEANIFDTFSVQQDPVEEVEEPEENEEVTFGFQGTEVASTDSFKYVSYESRNSDGTNTYVIYFFCDAEESWIDDNIQFDVSDVTPNGFISVMEDAGIAYSAPGASVNSSDSGLSKSGKVITVNTGMSTRYIKVTAYMNGEAVDSVYAICNGKMSDNTTYSAQDQELFEKTCIAVEAKIWTDDMSNLEKLQAFADYISSVSHYPDSDTTRAEYNPTWANRWGVDGSTDYKLIWRDFEDKYVDWTMALEGGQSTSLAADILEYVAQKHLGLKSISSADTSSGEGVYVGTGSLSSDPTSSSHYSLVYQAADGNRTFVDAQGMSYSASSDKVTCSAHGCQSRIIPISSYSADAEEGTAPETGKSDEEDDSVEFEVTESEGEYSEFYEDEYEFDDDVEYDFDEDYEVEIADDIAYELDDGTEYWFEDVEVYVFEDGLEYEFNDEVEYEFDDDYEIEFSDDVEYEVDGDYEVEFSDDVEYEVDDDYEIEFSDDVEYELDDDYEVEFNDDLEYEFDDDYEVEFDDDVEYEFDDDIEYEFDDDIEYEFDDDIEYELSDDIEYELDEEFDYEDDFEYDDEEESFLNNMLQTIKTSDAVGVILYIIMAGLAGLFILWVVHFRRNRV